MIQNYSFGKHITHSESSVLSLKAISTYRIFFKIIPDKARILPYVYLFLKALKKITTLDYFRENTVVKERLKLQEA
jgi:hypothetical protein